MIALHCQSCQWIKRRRNEMKWHEIKGAATNTKQNKTKQLILWTSHTEICTLIRIRQFAAMTLNRFVFLFLQHFLFVRLLKSLLGNFGSASNLGLPTNCSEFQMQTHGCICNLQRRISHRDHKLCKKKHKQQCSQAKNHAFSSCCYIVIPCNARTTQ